MNNRKSIRLGGKSAEIIINKFRPFIGKKQRFILQESGAPMNLVQKINTGLYFAHFN